jgi:hypothetical protein
MPPRPRPLCTGCGRHPDQIGEYLERAGYEGVTPDAIVEQDEGTYNPANGHFLCTACYIAAGSPSSPRGWRAP